MNEVVGASHLSTEACVEVSQEVRGRQLPVQLKHQGGGERRQRPKVPRHVGSLFAQTENDAKETQGRTFETMTWTEPKGNKVKVVSGQLSRSNTVRRNCCGGHVGP